jgi:hypothetical protein
VFYVNLPLSLLSLFMVIVKMPPLEHRRSGKIDFLGAALLIAAFVPLLLALSLGGHNFAWRSPQSLGLFALAAVSLVAFVVAETKVSNPILPMHLFQNKVFTTANLAGFLISMAFMGVVMFLPLFLQLGLGVPATVSGMTMLPLMAGLIISSTIAGQLVSKTGKYKPLMIVGAATAAGRRLPAARPVEDHHPAAAVPAAGLRRPGPGPGPEPVQHRHPERRRPARHRRGHQLQPVLPPDRLDRRRGPGRAMLTGQPARRRPGSGQAGRHGGRPRRPGAAERPDPRRQRRDGRGPVRDRGLGHHPLHPRPAPALARRLRTRLAAGTHPRGVLAASEEKPPRQGAARGHADPVASRRSTPRP